MSFVWWASAHALATQMSHPPRSVPPRLRSALKFGGGKLGGHFGPRKRIFSPPPPPKSPIRRRQPPGPSAPPGDPPPFLGFSIENLPPPSRRPRTPPSPSQSRKIKKYPKRPPRQDRARLNQRRHDRLYLHGPFQNHGLEPWAALPQNHGPAIRLCNHFYVLFFSPVPRRGFSGPWFRGGA